MKARIISLALSMLILESFADEIEDLERKLNEECYSIKGQFYEDAYKGWFYKEECKKLEKRISELKESQKQQKEKAKAKKEEYLSIIKSNLDNPEFWKKNEVYKWLKEDKNLEKIDQKTFREILDRVIYYSSLDPKNEEKISASVYMIDYSRRKSLDFSYAYTGYILKNPKYNISSRIGQGNFEAQYVRQEKDKEIEKILKNSKDYAIVMFASSECSYCLEQKRILGFLKDEIQPEIVVISVDKCEPFSDIATQCTVNPEAFVKFNIEITPTIFVYSKGIFEIASSGLINKTDLKRSIFATLYKIKTGQNFNWATSSIEDINKASR